MGSIICWLAEPSQIMLSLQKCYNILEPNERMYGLSFSGRESQLSNLHNSTHVQATGEPLNSGAVGAGSQELFPQNTVFRNINMIMLWADKVLVAEK